MKREKKENRKWKEKRKKNENEKRKEREMKMNRIEWNRSAEEIRLKNMRYDVISYDNVRRAQPTSCL